MCTLHMELIRAIVDERQERGGVGCLKWNEVCSGIIDWVLRSDVV